jgi:Flp pilus assembly protein TadD
MYHAALDHHRNWGEIALCCNQMRQFRLVVLLALALGACQDPAKNYVAQSVDTSLMQAATHAENSGGWLAAVATYRSLYERRPDDPAVAASLVRALRNTGQVQEAVRIAAEAAPKFPQEPRILGEHGKALLAARDLPGALRTLQAASELPGADWTIHSAMGVAYDLGGQHEAAQRAYAKALELSPDNLTVQNNLALSLALSGNIDAAIAKLEPQSFGQRDNPQTRQSLALLYALRGDLNRTESLVRKDLPEKLANENLAYYRLLNGLR